MFTQLTLYKDAELLDAATEEEPYEALLDRLTALLAAHPEFDIDTPLRRANGNDCTPASRVRGLE